MCAGALEPGDQVGVVRLVREFLRRNALGFAHPLYVVDRLTFLPGRVRFIEAYQCLKVPERFGVGRGPVRDFG